MKTVVLNRTEFDVRVYEGNASVWREIGRLRPGEKFNIQFDSNVTWNDYKCRAVPGRLITILFTADDCQDWESIELVQRGDGPTLSLRWEGITLRTTPEFRTAWKNACRKVEAVARFSEELEKDLKRVVIYRAQCAHLVQFCSERVQKIRENFHHVSGRLWGNSQQLEISLNNLLRALLSAQKLLKGCDQKEWRRAALVLSLPPPDPQNLEKYSGSKFAHVIRELGWSFDMVQYAMSEDATEGFKWDDGRDRHVLRRRNQPQDGVATNEMELLQGDLDRETCDRQSLLRDLENGLIPRDNFFISLARGSKISHQKFAQTIRDRCRTQDLDDLDLRKKKPIGKGAFKEVHKGKWLGLDMAIATFKLQQNSSRVREDVDIEDILREFKREAGFLVTIHHPNVVGFFGCAIQHDQAAFLVMELMEVDLGGLIESIMKDLASRSECSSSSSSNFRGPFSLSVTVDILMQIVEAMIHSHKHQVMHRDLKPANCLVSRKFAPRSDLDVHYTVKVTDFGMSKSWSSDLDAHSYKKGTVHYMAPEVWAPGGQYTCSADVYSFGMLCYEVITGSDPRTSPPFNRYMRAETRYELLSRGERPVIRGTCPESLSILMRKCWATTPTDRPTFKAIQRDLWDYRLLLEAQCVPRPPTS